MLINGIKFACNTCVKGHRSSNCNHIERPLFEIRKKGRPVTQCAFCRDLRKTRQIHIKCTCTDKSLKNIENTATTCYQCPSTVNEEQQQQEGISYSELIQNSLLNNKIQNNDTQCTCHEAANKILLSQQQNEQQLQLNSTAVFQQQENISTPILPVSSRSRGIDEVSPPGYNNYNQVQRSSSFRFLDGQTNSPRRKSSTSSSRSNSSSKRKSSIHYQQQQQQQQQYHVDEQMLDMQSLLFSQQQQQQRVTEIDKNECSSSMMMVNNNAFPSNASTTTTISSSSTPNSNYNMNNQNNQQGYTNYKDEEHMYNNNDIHLMMDTTDPDELTSLLNNVLNDRKQQETTANSVDMTRSNTTNSFSSTSSLNGNSSHFIVPQQHQHIVCGSFTPHSNCSPAAVMNPRGESVVITITPLQPTIEKNSKKPVTRIVTCYCGNSCICPGCFVHPNNYPIMQQQPFMPIQQQSKCSNNSSSYSSDDDEQYHLKYPTNYSLL